jgi:hypothetical protein
MPRNAAMRGLKASRFALKKLRIIGLTCKPRVFCEARLANT